MIRLEVVTEAAAAAAAAAAGLHVKGSIQLGIGTILSTRHPRLLYTIRKQALRHSSPRFLNASSLFPSFGTLSFRRFLSATQYFTTFQMWTISKKIREKISKAI